MSNYNCCAHVNCFSKLTVHRIALILGAFFVTYLFIYEIDINSTAVFARKILTPLTPLRQNDIPIVAEPLINFNNATTTTTTTVPSEKINNVVQVTRTSNGLTSVLNDSQNSNISEQPKEAFVTFSNNQPKYLAVLKVLLDSIHAFSTRPIIAFGIDVDLDIDTKEYPRVIKRRIKQSDCGPVRYIIFLSNRLIKIICILFLVCLFL